MFNDLNQANKQSHPATSPSAVDDIFAETDKAPESNKTLKTSNASAPSGGDIATKKVGLTANDGLDETSTDSSNNKWFKIILISIVVVIVILSIYLVYSKFLKVTPDLNSSSVLSTTKVNSPVVATSSATKTPGLLVATNTADVVPTSSPKDTSTIPLIPGVNAPAATTTVATTSAVVNPLLDSDHDGLTNIEEKALGTNPNLVDTDGDGLSDYEEVKIYHTDPLNPDTDGDGFPDGQEVKAGYNPLGAGKMAASKATLK